MEEKQVVCSNCGNSSHAPAKFCSNCSQLLHVHRITPGHLVHEIIHFFTHADKGIFYLIKKLATQPGKVAREYVEGRRKTYFSPLNFFLIVVGVFVFVNSSFQPMKTVSFDEMRQSVLAIPDETVRERRLAKVDRMENAINFMSTKSNYVNMALTPFISFIFYLFFIRRKYNYTEHLVANLYYAGFILLFYILVIVPYLLLTRGSKIYLAGIFVFLLFEAVFRGIAYYQFMNRRGFLSLLYPLFISFLLVTGWYFFSRMVIGYYIEHGFHL